jgi:stage V sporulation protein AC
MNNRQYKLLVDQTAPKTPKIKNTVKAFLSGGAICALGQILFDFAKARGASDENGRIIVTVSLVFAAAVLTALGIFDNIAKHTGAGTLVPITGFANAVVSPALEFKTEGMVLGVGAKLFSISGSVIVYGTTAALVYGFGYWLFG